MSQVAKLFMNGRSQAVRLPAAFRFEEKEVFIHRDPETGDVILSRKPQSLDHVFEMIENLRIPEDFPGADRGKPLPGRDPFSDWKE